MLGVPEQALSVLHEALEPVLAHGAVMDKGRALLLTARCQIAVAGFRPNRRGQAGEAPPLPQTTDLYLTASIHSRRCLLSPCRFSGIGCRHVEGGCSLLLQAEL